MTIATWQNQPAPTAEEQAAAIGPSSRVIDGVTRSDMNGTYEAGGVTRASSLDIASDSTSIFASARNNAGSPTAFLRDDTTIELIPGNPGSRTTLAAAAAMGYVKKTAHGDYVESGGTASRPTDGPQAEQVQQGQQAGGPELFASEQEEALVAAVADVPQHFLDNSVTKAALAIEAGGSPEDVGKRMADIARSISAATGLPEGQLQAAQEKVRATFQQQADDAVQKLGVDPAEFWEWAKANCQKELGRAVRDHLNARSLDTYRELVGVYQKNISPSLESLEARGFKTQRGERGGEDMVRVEGMWTTVSAAVKKGLL